MIESGLVGREALVASTVAAVRAGGRVRLVGDAGIGKSAVLGVAVEHLMAPADITVLGCTATPGDGHVPYLALIDLLGPVPSRHVASLAPPVRHAVDAALLRKPVDGIRESLAVRLGVLQLLRSLRAEGPVILVIDDIQWMDAASTDVVEFVLRRVPGAELPVLATERIEHPSS